MNIRNNISEDFANICNYLEANGITDIEQLDIFDLDELYFVPGVIDEKIEKFKNVIQNLKTEANIIKKNIVEKESIETSKLIIDEEKIVENNENFFTIILKNLEELYFEYHNKNEFIKEYIEFKKQMKVFENKHGIYFENYKSVESVYKDFPKGQKFIEYCNLNGWKCLEDLKNFDFENSKIRGIGIESLKLIEKKYREEMKEFQPVESLSEIFLKIHPDNLNISFISLIRFGFPEMLIEKYNLKNLDVKELKDINFSNEDLNVVSNIIHILQESMIEKFRRSYETKVKDNYKRMFLLRSEGKTLENIGSENNITRERVRQICKKVAEQLENEAILAMDALIEDESKGISTKEVENFINDIVLSNILTEVIKNTDEYIYIESIEKFIRKDSVPVNYFEEIETYLKKIATSGINYYELVNSMEKYLQYNFFDEEDLKFFLYSRGFSMIGDIVYKGRIPFSKIVFNLVERYYDYDIKLDQDETNEDMIKLRKLMKEHYNGLTYEANNRSFTSIITRDVQSFVLSGRGRYCPITKIDCHFDIIKKIKQQILDSKVNTIYYSDLFEKNRNRLLTETSIDNYNCLHGMLMYYFPDEFVYSRDYLTKQGEVTLTIDEQIIELIEEKEGVVKYDDIILKFPSLNKIRLNFLIERNNQLINWDTDEYNSIKNIKNFDSDKYSKIIHMLLKSNNGYISSRQLYNYVVEFEKELLEKNYIKTDKSLFYVCNYYLNVYFDFRYPHITQKDKYETLSTYNIIVNLVNNEHKLNMNNILDFAKQVQWKDSTAYAALAEIQNNFIKVSKDEFVERTHFVINDDALIQIEKIIDYYLEVSGFYSLMSIHDFSNFPEIDYEWNSFLLEQIIETYIKKYKLVRPLIKDRRYQRTIVINDHLQIKDFGELIVYIMLKDGKDYYSKKELMNLLSRNDVINDSLPQEIYSCDMIEYKNELFKVKNLNIERK